MKAPDGFQKNSVNINNDTKIASGESYFLGPKKEKICAILVTYFPDTHFVERLERIREQVGKIIIVDNTTDPACGVSSLALLSSVEIIQNRENLGVGAALNQGVAHAIGLGYPWVITFDQDSWVHEDLVTTSIGIYEQQPRPELVGIIGCNFEDENTHTAAIRFKHNEPNFAETDTVITSGSLLSAGAFSAAGPFRSDFFIDFIDHEYCLRLLKLGYKVLIATAPLMVHALGAATTVTMENGAGRFSLVLTNRSPLRRYYMTRNGVLVAKMYFAVAPKPIFRILGTLLGFSLLKIPLEKTGRWKKFCATLFGLFDALRGRTGKASARWTGE
jgi:rhamnosyltransferase